MKTLNFEPRTLNFSCAAVALALTVCNNGTAQIQQAWVARYNNGIPNSTHEAVKMVLDATGNIYVTAFSRNTNANLGYVTIKYAPNGNQLWASRFDSNTYPSATPFGLALDNSNNVIVTGNVLTIKYDTNGNQIWTVPYSGTALAVDTNGNVAVTGFGTSFNTVKLNPSGSNLWQETFQASCGAAVGQAISVDTSGNFYVAGNCPYFCENEVVDYELLIIKYAADGNQSWTSSYAGQGNWQVGGSTLDSADNLYLVADDNGGGHFVVLMWSANGALNWASGLTSSLGAQSHGIEVDSNRNVDVTGQINYSYNYALGTYNYYYGTFKLSTSGNPMWTNSFPQPPTGSSVATSIAVDNANSVYVTGYSPGTNSSNDIVTIKYGRNGNQLWLQRYHGPGSGNDAGNAIAVDNNGNVYVTGYEATAAGGTEIVTIKYSPVTLKKQANGSFLLQAQGPPGESFDIQASANLINWLDLGTVIADTNGLMQFADTNASNFTSRYYITNPQ